MKEKPQWEESIAVPVVSNQTAALNLNDLKSILSKSIEINARECVSQNSGTICTTLSGGIDSSYCLAKIRETLGRKVIIHTFTTGGSEKHPDIQYARLVSRLFDSVHHELIPSQENIETAQKVLYSLWEDEPRALGNVGVYLTYKSIAQHGFRSVIAHDGIDELLGGYWEHRKHQNTEDKIKAFQRLWSRLDQDHLSLLTRKAQYFDTKVLFPYLYKDLVEFISKISVDERTSFSVSKIPLRAIAKECLPLEIIERRKMGFCSALD